MPTEPDLETARSMLKNDPKVAQKKPQTYQETMATEPDLETARSNVNDDIAQKKPKTPQQAITTEPVLKTAPQSNKIIGNPKVTQIKTKSSKVDRK